MCDYLIDKIKRNEPLTVDEVFDLQADLDCNFNEEDLPPVLQAMVTRGPGGYCICINKYADRTKLNQVIVHEINHIQNDDFTNGKPISLKESHADYK